MERSNLRKVNNVEVKEEYLKSQIVLQLWKTLMMMMMMWASSGLGKSIRQNTDASATGSLGYYKLKQHK
jgi:hypothetical protein